MARSSANAGRSENQGDGAAPRPSDRLNAIHAAFCTASHAVRPVPKPSCASAQAVLRLAGQSQAVVRPTIELALRNRLPTMLVLKEDVRAGALMSYDPDRATITRRSADFVDKILKGAKPADLPVEQPTTFELVKNLKMAKALGLKIPQSVLVRADEIIQ